MVFGSAAQLPNTKCVITQSFVVLNSMILNCLWWERDFSAEMNQKYLHFRYHLLTVSNFWKKKKLCAHVKLNSAKCQGETQATSPAPLRWNIRGWVGVRAALKMDASIFDQQTSQAGITFPQTKYTHFLPCCLLVYIPLFVIFWQRGGGRWWRWWWWGGADSWRTAAQRSAELFRCASSLPAPGGKVRTMPGPSSGVAHVDSRLARDTSATLATPSDCALHNFPQLWCDIKSGAEEKWLYW